MASMKHGQQIDHNIRIGDRVSVPGGYHPDGSSNPRRYGYVRELYGPNGWPRIAFDDRLGQLETVTPNALQVEPHLVPTHWMKNGK